MHSFFLFLQLIQMNAKVSNKYYVEAFFSSIDNGKHQCILCPLESQTITQKKGTGFMNLMNHLDVKHEHFKLIY